MNKRFKIFRVTQSALFLLIPLILFWVNGSLLDSISAYANYTEMTFALSLTLAGALFMYDGFYNEKHAYNIYVGLALFGVVLFRHNEFPIVHYAFAGLFFLGSLFNMVFFSSNDERFLKSFVAFIVLFGMSGSFIFHWYTIYWAEWFGMIPISLHYILETTEKID